MAGPCMAGQCLAPRGKDRGKTGHGMPRQGLARHFLACPGTAWILARLGKASARRSEASHGAAGNSARHAKAEALHGMARLGPARRGKAWILARRVLASRGTALSGVAWRVLARIRAGHGKASLGEARQVSAGIFGLAWQGYAGHGMAGIGVARQGADKGRAVPGEARHRQDLSRLG